MTDSIYAWSQTADDNGTADATINFAEFQLPATLNNSNRALMARIAALISDMAPKRTSTGSANNYAVTSDAAGATPVDGEQITFIPHASNTSGCTLNVDGRGATGWRPAPSTEFVADNILAGVPVTAYYRASSNEWLSPGTGYYVSQMASGVALQSITARLPQIGDMVVSYSATPAAGRIRLTETVQSILKSAYPELSAHLSSLGYPFGSSATHFSLPAAAGYFLRIAASNSTIDTGGPRLAGSTQNQQVLAHTHTVTVSGTTSADGAHSHTVLSIADTQVGSDGNGAQAYQTTRSTSTEGTHAHNVTSTGTTAATGDIEQRVKNVAFHLDVIASFSLSAAQLAVFGFPFQWDTGTTAADPGAGRVRTNNATIASSTAMYISTTDGWGVDISGIFAAFGSGNILTFSKVGAQATRIVFRLTSTPVAGSGYYTLAGTVVSSNGTFTANDQFAFEYSSGSQGPTGDAGSDGGIRWSYSASTAMADPGTGFLRLNSGTMSSVTGMAIANTTAENGNPDVTDYILSWDDSTSTSARGTLTLRSEANVGTFAIYQITSAVTDHSGWNEMSLAYVDHAGSFAADETLSVGFSRTGDKGADGAGSGTVTSITAGPGLSSTGAGSTGGAITASGTLTAVSAVNVDSSSVYTYLAADHGKLVVRTYAGVMSDTLPSVTGSFDDGYYVDIYNAGTGIVILTAASTINGLSTYVLNPAASVRVVSDGTTYRAIAGSGGINTQPQGRLTLTSATAIMSATVSGATTVYYTPASGRYVPLYDGANIITVDIGGELSQATTDATKSPAACTTNSNYDVFVWQDGTSFRATRGPAWSTSTSRGTGAGTTELAAVKGLLVNANAITNGPAANRGTYVGTIHTNASSTVDMKFGSSAAGGGNILFGVWNAYNQTIYRTTGYDSTASWTYAGGAVRNSNNSASNSAAFIKGLGGSAPQFQFLQRVQSPGAGFALIFIYLDGSGAASARSGALAGVDGFANAVYNDDPGIGWHTLQCCENCSASSNFIAGGTGADMQFSLTYLG